MADPKPGGSRPTREGRGTSRAAVIGAGLSGLAAARRLIELGHEVRLFDKARGVGGRCSTRRSNGLRFDHGAQFFTAREEAFVEALAPLLEAGQVAEWQPRIARVARGGRRSPAPDSVRYVGVPGMSALGKGLAAGLDVELRARVVSLDRHEGKWMLVLEDEHSAGPFQAVVVTCPAPQAAELLRDVNPMLAEACHAAVFLPCWSVMAAFDRPLGFDLDAAFVDDAVVAWTACESSKPGRAPEPECWTLHAGPAWSAEHLEHETDAVARTILGRFIRIAGARADPPIHLEAHRWRYARAAPPAGAERRWVDSADRIAVAGDWLHGDRIEDAFMSGHAVGGELARVMDTDR